MALFFQNAFTFQFALLQGLPMLQILFMGLSTVTRLPQVLLGFLKAHHSVEAEVIG